MKKVQCKFCGETGLRWWRASTADRPFLHGKNNILHVCKADPKMRGFLSSLDKKLNQKVRDPEIAAYLARVPYHGSWASKVRRSSSG